MMTEKRSPKPDVAAPVNLDDHRVKRVQQRADDEHIREMMRALVEAIEDSKQSPRSQPTSELW
ncbi:MAG: hypothetical protein QOF68_1713 [Gaiellales bacterium]|nr:hypothetical protein [Gaiellales bacterium]